MAQRNFKNSIRPRGRVAAGPEFVLKRTTMQNYALGGQVTMMMVMMMMVIRGS
jgi:hypothetical protein